MSESILGVIIGGAFTLLGGIMGSFLQHNWEVKRFRKDQMKEAYEAAEQCLIESVCSTEYRDPDRYLQTVDFMTVKMSLYASKKALDFYENMSDLLNKINLTDEERFTIGLMSEQLDKMMRSDLGIDKNPCIRNSKFLNLFRHSAKPRGGKDS